MKKILRIVAVLCMSLTFCFAGCTPWGYWQAREVAEAYLQEKYGDTDYEIERIGYDYKMGEYDVSIASPTKIDEHFVLSIDDGELRFDNYDRVVSSLENTVNRLEQEYYAVAFELFRGEDYPYDENWTICHIKFDYEEGEIIPEGALLWSELELNKEYDISRLTKKQGCIETNVMNEQVSFERAAEILLDIKRRADEKGVYFYEISFSLHEKISWEPGDSISVSHFLYSDIYEEGLAERLQQASEN